jgi:hypothetical protein
MSVQVQEIKEKLAAFPEEIRTRSWLFFSISRHADDREYQDALAQRLEGKEPGHWLTPD